MNIIPPSEPHHFLKFRSNILFNGILLVILHHEQLILNEMRNFNKKTNKQTVIGRIMQIAYNLRHWLNNPDNKEKLGYTTLIILTFMVSYFLYFLAGILS